MDVAIVGGTVVTADATYQADVGIRDDKVVQIGGVLPSATRTIDARGKYVMPGGVDPHTHFDSRSQGTMTADDWGTGSIAAACGGTTTVVDMCFPEKGKSLASGLEEWHDRARGKTAIDYGLHVTVLDEREDIFDEIPRVSELGVTTLKLFMAYRSTIMVTDVALYRALRLAAKHGLLCLVHAENGDAVAEREKELAAAGKLAPKYHAVARPPRVEAEATARAVALAELAEAPLYVVHVSCAEAIEEIVRGRARGARVYGETCSQYLVFTEDDLDRPEFEGAKYVCSPALRAAWQRDVLWRALDDGTLQVLASDHSAFDFHGANQKERGRADFRDIPNGVPGVEERLMVGYQGVVAGKLGLNRFVDVVSTAPARIHGLFPRKGTVAVGADADLVVWDPEAELTITQSALHHRVDYTCYEGMRVKGAPDTVLSRGEVIVEGREFVGKPGRGQFLRRIPSPSGRGLG
jgi:dihydropyrimidinase